LKLLSVLIFLFYISIHVQNAWFQIYFSIKCTDSSSSNHHQLVDVAFCKVEVALGTVEETKETVDGKKAKLQYQNVTW
jgi:hypothetical protein